MPQAEIITIGTELLLGEIQDTNTRYIAHQFRQLGIDLFRVTLVGDNPLRIADMIRESLSRADIVITTGGLGPTIDDPTRNAASIAFNTEMIFHAELWKVIYNRFQLRGIIPSDNNKKQAFLPSNACAIHNPVGTAPAFYILEGDKIVVSLPGVPAEMETVFQESVIPLLQKHFRLDQLIKTRIIHTSGIGESNVDHAIADLEILSNPTVGLSAHPGRVDIRITAKATSIDIADRMINEIEVEILKRLPRRVFGFDEDTLLSKIIDLAQKKNVSVHLLTHGIPHDPISIREHNARRLIHIKKIEQPYSAQKLLKPVPGVLCFAANLTRKEGTSELEMFFLCPDGQDRHQRQFNGPPSLLEKWIENTCLDYMWQKMTDSSELE